VLTHEEVLRFARWGRIIEDHDNTPMDIEWAKDGERDTIFTVQARPETVHSRKKGAMLKTYALQERGDPIVTGLSIGQGIGTGEVLVIDSADEIDRFRKGAVLGTTMTDPDWVPIMKQASAIVTDLGGRTSHAAIVSRELGMPRSTVTDSPSNAGPSDRSAKGWASGMSSSRSRSTHPGKAQPAGRSRTLGRSDRGRPSGA